MCHDFMLWLYVFPVITKSKINFKNEINALCFCLSKLNYFLCWQLPITSSKSCRNEVMHGRKLSVMIQIDFQCSSCALLINSEVFSVSRLLCFKISKSFSDKLNKSLCSFLWNGKSPRVKLSTLQAPYSKGELSLPSFGCYYLAAQFRSVWCWLHGDNSVTRWLPVEQHQLKNVPFKSLPFLTSIKKRRFSYINIYIWVDDCNVQTCAYYRPTGKQTGQHHTHSLSLPSKPRARTEKKKKEKGTIRTLITIATCA